MLQAIFKDLGLDPSASIVDVVFSFQMPILKSTFTLAAGMWKWIHVRGTTCSWFPKRRRERLLF
jgi:hypothetical protein